MVLTALEFAIERALVMCRMMVTTTKTNPITPADIPNSFTSLACPLKKPPYAYLRFVYNRLAQITIARDHTYINI